MEGFISVIEKTGSWFFGKIFFLTSWSTAIIVAIVVAVVAFFLRQDWKKINTTLWHYIDIPAKLIVIK
jgi:hypothetical protein